MRSKAGARSRVRARRLKRPGGSCVLVSSSVVYSWHELAIILAICDLCTLSFGEASSMQRLLLIYLDAHLAKVLPRLQISVGLWRVFPAEHLPD